MTKDSQMTKNDIFYEMINKFISNKLYVIALRDAKKRYELKYLRLNNLTPLRVIKLWQQLILKYQSGINNEHEWLLNERRFYLWMLLCYMKLHNKVVQQLDDENFIQFQTLLNNKQIILIKYQAYNLIKQNRKTNQWHKKQDQILRKIISQRNQTNEKQWNQISKIFFKCSNFQYFRNSKQCRQRWYNHLDPIKTKGNWTLQQDLIIYKSIKNHGKKWSKIVIDLQNIKNDHAVKNRYYSLMKKYQKKYSQIINDNKLQDQIIQDLEIKKNNCLENKLQNIDFSVHSIDPKVYSKTIQFVQKKNSMHSKNSQNQQNFSENQSENYQSKASQNHVQVDDQIIQQIFQQNMIDDQGHIENRTHNGQIIGPPILLSNKSPVFITSPFGNFTPTQFWVDEIRMSNSINDFTSGKFGQVFNNAFDQFIGQTSKDKTQ